MRNNRLKQKNEWKFSGLHKREYLFIYSSHQTYFISNFRIGLDPCLLFATFETMLSQLRSTGEINISSFSKHLSSRHDLALSSVDQYVYLHDTVAAAIECGHLHGVIQIRNGNHFGGKYKFES